MVNFTYDYEFRPSRFFFGLLVFASQADANFAFFSQLRSIKAN